MEESESPLFEKEGSGEIFTAIDSASLRKSPLIPLCQRGEVYWSLDFLDCNTASSGGRCKTVFPSGNSSSRYALVVIPTVEVWNGACRSSAKGRISLQLRLNELKL